MKHIVEGVSSDTQQHPELDTPFPARNPFPVWQTLLPQWKEDCWYQEGFCVQLEPEPFTDAAEMYGDDQGLKKVRQFLTSHC